MREIRGRSWCFGENKEVEMSCSLRIQTANLQFDIGIDLSDNCSSRIEMRRSALQGFTLG